MIKVFCVLGDPIAHSLSPAMHNAVFRSLGMKSCYLPFRVCKDDLKDAILGAKAMGFSGMNLTIPLKEAALSLVEADEDARAIGAVNTISFKGGIKGYNTDGNGALKALKSEGVEVKGRNVTIIGAGGASRAIAYRLSKEGASIHIANRTLSKAVDLARAFGGVAHDLSMLSSLVKDSDVIINTTSVGMNEGDFELFSRELLNPSQAVMDIVYNRETALLKGAKAKGCKALDGVMMLVYQGALAFEIWTGIVPPTNVMELAVKEALANRIPRPTGLDL